MNQGSRETWKYRKTGRNQEISRIKIDNFDDGMKNEYKCFIVRKMSDNYLFEILIEKILSTASG